MIAKINHPDGVEIGSIPKGAGLDHLRWDNEQEQLIDLVNLSSIWVEYTKGAFFLHCVEVPHSQLVRMRYQHRKKLWNNNGVYSIKQASQEKEETNREYRKSHYPPIGDQLGAIIKYLATQPNLPAELQKTIDDIEAIKEKYPTGTNMTVG